MGMRASRVERRYATLDARTVLSSLPSRVAQTAGKGRRTDILYLLYVGGKIDKNRYARVAAQLLP